MAESDGEFPAVDPASAEDFPAGSFNLNVVVDRTTISRWADVDLWDTGVRLRVDDPAHVARLSLFRAYLEEAVAALGRCHGNNSEQLDFKITIGAGGSLVFAGLPGVEDLLSSASSPVVSIAEQASAAIAELTELASGWDGYDGVPVRPQVAKHAFEFLKAIGKHTHFAPDVIPLSDGGMQLEWFVGVYEVEVVIAPDLATQIFFECTSDGRSEEIPLDDSLDVSGVVPFFLELHR